MISAKNIKKSMFVFDKLIIGIIVFIAVINLSINIGTRLIFDDSMTVQTLMTSIKLQISIYILIYMSIYGLLISLSVIPHLVSLNCPRKLLGKTTIKQGLIRSIILTLIFIVTMYCFKTNFMFGKKFMTIGVFDLFRIILLSWTAAFLIYNFLLNIGLVAYKSGWLLFTLIFFVLGVVMMSIKQIIVLVVFGVGINYFIACMLVINIIFCLVNYKLICFYEYKF
ncbi:hypothetical protein [Abyssisolibacter fermentans]|uniref:hypothetical protein n=1 Tax=Abyssisolibacter fermentans TaxID=1766203 RepID=UPI00082F4EE4|nr:hypothetical protein [Abyssisolibacter fermentans]